MRQRLHVDIIKSPLVTRINLQSNNGVLATCLNLIVVDAFVGRTYRRRARQN
jgi:hypothetical protein